MDPRHLLPHPKRTSITEESKIPSTKEDVCMMALDRTSTSATLTFQSWAQTSSATLKPSTCTSSTSTCLWAGTPEPFQTVTGRAPARTLHLTATLPATGPRGAARGLWRPRRLARANWASTELTLKLSSWARITTASTRPSTVFTALTPQPPPPRSPALSVTIQTYKAPATTARIPATRPACTSTRTSIPHVGRTGATSSTACPFLPPTVPPPTGINRFTPHYPGLKARPLCTASVTIMKGFVPTNQAMSACWFFDTSKHWRLVLNVMILCLWLKASRNPPWGLPDASGLKRNGTNENSGSFSFSQNPS